MLATLLRGFFIRVSIVLRITRRVLDPPLSLENAAYFGLLLPVMLVVHHVFLPFDLLGFLQGDHDEFLLLLFLPFLENPHAKENFFYQP